MTDRRNPYLILGIDHGTDPSQAASGFASATRRVRTDSNAPYTMEDITWALHRIEKAETDPNAALDIFRVPADPAAYLDGSLGDLLPPSPPLRRTTSEPGQGRQLITDQALLVELQNDLAEATTHLLDEAVIEPVEVDLKPQPASRVSEGRLPATGRPSQPPPPANPRRSAPTESSGGLSRGVWYALLALLAFFVLIAVLDALQDRESDPAASDAGPADSSIDPDPDPVPDPDPGIQDSPESEPQPEAPRAPQPEAEPVLRPWVERGDCLELVGDDLWEPGSCLSPDAEIVQTRQGASGGLSCPQGSDGWIEDDWGEYCLLIVSDDTVEGGHWGIGPVYAGSCVEIDSQGRLVGRSTCSGSGVPVLTVAASPDDCSLAPSVSDFYVYWEAIDGTSNAICIDRYDWDAAGLPPPP